MSQSRYRCNICWDRGMVHVVNPRFLEAYRETFLELPKDEEGKLPRGWQGDAGRFCQKLEMGPMKHMALCVCDCPRALTFRSELGKYNAGSRRTKRPPACGVVKYNPSVMPIARWELGIVLTEWYAEHTVNEVHEVDELPGNYEEMFG